MTVEVKSLYKYPNFEELYKHFNKISMGYDKDDIANPEDMEQYYSKEEQDKYGVIGIEIKVIEKNNVDGKGMEINWKKKLNQLMEKF